MASQCGHQEIVHLLCERGAALNTQRKSDGSTALYMASQLGHLDIVRLLCESGCDTLVKYKGSNAYEMAKLLHGSSAPITRFLKKYPH